MKKDSFIIMTCYQGHKEGLKEAKAVLKFVKSLDESFTILKYEHINNKIAPFVLVIEKK